MNLNAFALTLEQRQIRILTRNVGYSVDVNNGLGHIFLVTSGKLHMTVI